MLCASPAANVLGYDGEAAHCRKERGEEGYLYLTVSLR